LTILKEDEKQTATLIAQTEEEGLIARGRVALSFRIGSIYVLDPGSRPWPSVSLEHSHRTSINSRIYVDTDDDGSGQHHRNCVTVLSCATRSEMRALLTTVMSDA
jgi:hypothetical protein